MRNRILGSVVVVACAALLALWVLRSSMGEAAPAQGFEVSAPQVASVGVAAENERGESDRVAVRRPVAGGGIVELDLVLEPCLRVLGSVLTAEGSPVVGAQVVAKRFTPIFRTGSTSPEPDPVTSDAAGGFELRLRKNVRYHVRAKRGGDQTWPEIVLMGDEQSALIVLRMPGACSVSGTVREVHGAVVPGAIVLAWNDDPNQSRLATVADDHGAFRIALPTSPAFEVMATSERLPSSVPVLDAVGAPASGVTVVVGGCGLFNNHQRCTDAAGRVSFDRCAPGQARLCCVRGTDVLAEQTVELAAGMRSEFVVTLPAADAPR